MSKASPQKEKIQLMKEGGSKLTTIRDILIKNVKPGVRASQIEKLANELIKGHGGKPSFKMVPGYSWATCINVNEGVVHGIPHENIVFKEGDLVSIDVGFYYKGFHTDTSVTAGVGKIDKNKEKFLQVGRKTLQNAINILSPGIHIGEISALIQNNLESSGYHPIKELTGHGIGEKLHEDPAIPCFLDTSIKNTPIVKSGSTLAIEVMYADRKSNLALASDSWTIASKNAKMAGLFEDTVAVTSEGNIILTH